MGYIISEKQPERGSSGEVFFAKSSKDNIEYAFKALSLTNKYSKASSLKRK